MSSLYNFSFYYIPYTFVSLILFACASIFYICGCVSFGVVINLVLQASIYSPYSLVLFKAIQH